MPGKKNLRVSNIQIINISELYVGDISDNDRTKRVIVTKGVLFLNW